MKKGVLDARAEFKMVLWMDIQNYITQVENYLAEATSKMGTSWSSKDYYEDGKLKMELNYKNGKPEGLEEVTIQMEKYL